MKDVYLAAYLPNSATTIILKIPVGEAGEDAVVPCVRELELWRRGRLKAERSRLN